jgi:TonB family protein
MTAIAQSLSSALLHFLWQGVLVAFVLWIALFLLRKRSAQARYTASCAALALMVALPAITAWTLYDHPVAAPTTAQAAASEAPSAATVATPGTPNLALLWLAAFQQWALPVWSFGVLLFSIRLVWGCTQISRLRRRGAMPDEALRTLLAALARRLGVKQPVRILIAVDGESPSVVGWLRPVVLIPSAALLGLTTEQLEAVLAHELAHVRRHDYLVNMLQILAETLLFYHPAVWWVSARIRHERELCCDDIAVRACGDAVCYARALTRLERLRITAPAMAMGSNSGSMLYRIQRLLGGGAQEYAPSKLPAILALVLGVACFGLNIHWAHAQEKGPIAVAVTFDVHDSPGVTVDLGGAALLHRSSVEYPGVARERGVEGTVVAEVTLDESGQVSGTRVLSGPPELRRSALRSVLDWHFAQSAANGIYQVRINYNRAQAEAEPSGGYTVSEPGRATITADHAVTYRVRSEPERTELWRTELARPEQDRAMSGSTEIARTEPERAEQVMQATQFLRRELESVQAQTANNPSEESRLRVNELRNRLHSLEALTPERANEPASLAGRTLRSINVFGLPENSKGALMEKLGIHLGDTLTQESMEAATAVARQFDEHLEVIFKTAGENQAEVRIVAPRAGIYEFRPQQK